MKNNYKFFQNRECEYFPCHKVSNEENFNCLFCYCALYFLDEKCGGNFKYYNGIKDCSQCFIPHGEKGYDYIIGKIMEVNAERKKGGGK